MKGKIIILITAIAVIALTLTVYNVAVSEWTSNLQISAAVVCFAELAIFCTMGLLPVMNYKNGSTGIMINIYAGLMILWSLIGFGFEGNTFVVGLLCISAIMLIFIGMSVMGSHESEELNDQVERTISRKQSYATASPAAYKTSPISQPSGGENLSSMWLEMKSSIDDPDTLKRVRVLVERIQAMPASVFPNTTIECGMKEIAAMSRALANAEDPNKVQERMSQKIKELTNYIKTM